MSSILSPELVAIARKAYNATKPCISVDPKGLEAALSAAIPLLEAAIRKDEREKYRQERGVLAAALLWARNHLEVGKEELRDKVIEKIDRVLKYREPTIADMKRFRAFEGLDLTQPQGEDDGRTL